VSGGSGSGNSDSTISTLITDISQVASTISGNVTNYVPNDYLAELHTSTLYTSSISMAGLRQPFIQYGVQKVILGTSTVTMPYPYINTSYVVQITPIDRGPFSQQSYISIVNMSSFNINTTYAEEIDFGWTTFGDLY
jgi:hypothetical protein